MGDDSKVTLEFVTELMKFFQGQGRLHKKYAVAIIKQTHQLLQSLPSLVEVSHTPVVCSWHGTRTRPLI